ncbi:unnamed protein product, partial [Ectocarpus sp. 13 AM-2016]
RATVGAKDLSRGLSRRERVRQFRRERGLNERPPGGEGAVWPPVDDPMEELTELVWPSSELPALEVNMSVDEAACLLSFHGRPLSELQLRRGLTIGVETFRQGLGRRAMECRGLLRGLLLWDRTGSASGELACIISSLDGPHPSALKPATAAAAATGLPPASAAVENSAANAGFLEEGETAAFLLPRESAEAGNRGVELQWLFTGRISEAEARADREARGLSSAGPGVEGVVAREGTPRREPRPPILRARFSAARVVYLQRFTMEQAREEDDGGSSSICLIPQLCLFRPPLRRRLPPAAGNPTTPSEDTRRGKRDGTGGDSPSAAAVPPDTAAQASGKRRGRALGVGLGEGGMSAGDGGGDGEGSEWEEGEPTDFVYTGLFPGEAKGWGGREGEEEEEPVLLFEDETVEDGQ